jgi:predicted Fe-Mo cluster-binding NifX family protein
MNIAISAAGPDLDSPVHAEFRSTPFLLIVNMEDMTCRSLDTGTGDMTDHDLARIVLEHRCEALITGKLSENAFRLLADDGVTRYKGHGLTAREALTAMEQRELNFIRNAEGTDSCESNHHGLEDLRVCSEHTH